MNKVCGTDRGSLSLKERAEAVIQKGMTTGGEAALPVVLAVGSTERGEGIVAPTTPLMSNEIDAPSAVALEKAPVVNAPLAKTATDVRDAATGLSNGDQTSPTPYRLPILSCPWGVHLATDSNLTAHVVRQRARPDGGNAQRTSRQNAKTKGPLVANSQGE